MTERFADSAARRVTATFADLAFPPCNTDFSQPGSAKKWSRSLPLHAYVWRVAARTTEDPKPQKGIFNDHTRISHLIR